MINNSRGPGSATARAAATVGLAALASVGGVACRRADVTDGRYQGMIEYEERDLAFELPGRITDLGVARGQEVRAGDAIARQDDAVDREARAVDARTVAVAQADLDLVKAGSRSEEVRAAEATLSAARATELNAQKELARQQTLVDKGALPGAGLDALEAQLAAATGARQAQEARLAELRKGARHEEIDRAAARVAQATQALSLDDKRLDKRTLVAPITGVIEDVFALSGEMASAGTPVVSLLDVHHPYADVFVPIEEAPRVRIGDVAHLRVEGLAAEATGAVELVHREAEFTPKFVFSPRERPNLMIRVRVRIDDPDGRLHAGLPTYVTFDDGGARTAAKAAAPAPAAGGAR